MVVRPGGDIQIGTEGHHEAGQLQALGDRQGEHAAAAVADEHDTPRAPARDLRLQRRGHGAADLRRVARRGPQPRAAAGAVGETMVTRAPEVQGGSPILAHELEGERTAAAGVRGREAPPQPGAAIPAEVYVQFVALCRGDVAGVNAQGKAAGLHSAALPAGIASDLLGPIQWHTAGYHVGYGNEEPGQPATDGVATEGRPRAGCRGGH